MSVNGSIAPLTKLIVSPTGDDDANLAFPCRAIYIAADGDVKVTTPYSTYTVTLGVGLYPIEITKIFATGTTATIGFVGA